MSRYLIGNLTPNFWLLGASWLSSDDVPGDALRDLRIKNNALSVYEIADDAGAGHIRRVAAAIGAAFKDKPCDIAHRLIDPERVAELRIDVAQTPGNLGDDELNPSHRDLIKLSAITLGRLAAVIAHSDGGLLLSKDFTQIVIRETQAGRLRPNSKLKQELRL